MNYTQNQVGLQSSFKSKHL